MCDMPTARAMRYWALLGFVNNSLGGIWQVRGKVLYVVG